MYPGYNMIINTILVFYAIKKLDADSSKQVRVDLELCCLQTPLIRSRAGRFAIQISK